MACKAGHWPGDQDRLGTWGWLCTCIWNSLNASAPMADWEPGAHHACAEAHNPLDFVKESCSVATGGHGISQLHSLHVIVPHRLGAGGPISPSLPLFIQVPGIPPPSRGIPVQILENCDFLSPLLYKHPAPRTLPCFTSGQNVGILT